MQIRLTFALLLAFLSFGLHGQTVTGVVSDSNGSPLPFAAVAEQGTNNGVETDLDGKYSITLTNSQAVIEYHYLGFKSQTIPYAGKNTIDIVLSEDSQVLDDIVVVGYGVQKKSDVTGAVSKVKVDDAKVLPTTNVSEMLRGKSAGVQVTLSDPRPGGSSNILIRGSNSILGGNDPLIVLDGIPIDNINSVNPEDIASMEILKDASAQAIYGARASNGVILITTKRGKKGVLKASYHGFYGEQWLTKNFELYSGKEWAQLRREAYRTDNNDEYELEEFVFTPLMQEIIESGEYVDWEDEVMQNSTQQSHSLSLQAGGEKTSFFASFGFYDQGGLIPGSGYKRGTARLNMDYEVSKRLKFGTNIYLLTDKQDKESTSLNFITLSPLAKVRDENGKIMRYPTGNQSTYNPLWNLREYTSDNKSNEYQFTLFGEFEILKNLKYRLNTSLTRRNTLGGIHRSRLHSSSADEGGRGTIFGSGREEYLIENILNYNLDINTNNRLDVTLMQSANEREYSSFSAIATDLPYDALGYDGIAFANNSLPVPRTAWDRSLLSFMGRARYYLNDKYLLTLTGRADASSVFAAGNKWSFFPSVALAWKAHLEPFIDDLAFINEFKVRVSYGGIGNEAISPYQTLGLATVENYIFDGVSTGGADPGSKLFNPNLKWETSTTLNVGLDFGLFKNILVGNLEFYNTQTTDLLVDRTTPGGTGYSSIISNIGRVQNQGVELGLTTNIIRKKNFDWSFTTNFSRNKNEILELFGETDKDGNLLDDISRKRFIGHPINVIYQYEFDGIWQTEEEIADSHMPDAEPGSIRVKDIDGDNVITTDDRVILHADPSWIGSISTRIQFRGFELFGDLYTVQGVKRYNSFLADFNQGGTLQGKLNGIKVDYWTPENPSTTFPRPKLSGADNKLWALAVRDASYIRLRTVSLAYHLPKKWTEKAKLGGVTLYSTFTNPMTWTDYKSYSPETTVGTYPDGKSFIFGIKLSN